jgi:hypothetical protein
MQGFPKWFNTKEDIVNTLPNFPEETKEYLISLLKDRFIWTETEGEFVLSEDIEARMFQLGFTVPEIIDIVGDVEIVPACPSSFHVWNEETKVWEVDTVAKNSEIKKQIIAKYQGKFDELKLAYLAKIGMGTANEATYKTQYAAVRTELMTELNNVGV